MKIDGVVRAVMETFPLQLQIEAEGVIHHVSMTESTSVSSRGRAVDPGRITPSARVRVSGAAASADGAAFTADTVEILEP